MYGQLVSGTLGGGSVEGIEVTLRIFRGTAEEPARVALSGADGSFVFEGLDTGQDSSYLIQATYESVVYSQGMFSFEERRHRTNGAGARLWHDDQL